MPAIGTPASAPFSRTLPYSSDDDLISGSIDVGIFMSSAMDASHDRVDRSISSVRDALVGSVTCTPPSGPPVMFHSSQVSMLPNSRSPASARCRAPSTLSRIQRVLGPEKYVASGRPVLALYRSCPPPSASSSAQILSVRVSCQTTALYTGLPVLRSQTTAVSRWFVMPTATMSEALRSALPSGPGATPRVLRQPSSGSCSTQPACGKICSCSFWSTDTTLPSWLKIMHRVEVVP